MAATAGRPGSSSAPLGSPTRSTASLLVGWKAVAPEGYELDVNLIGKAATWLLYAGIAFLIVTHRSTDWPYWIFWTGLVLAVLAGLVYAYGALKEVKR